MCPDKHNVGTCQGKEFKRNASRNARPQPSQLVEALWTDPGLKGGIDMLHCLYRALVRSKLDYGFIVHGAALKRILQKLDPIHHQSLRIAL